MVVSKIFLLCSTNAPITLKLCSLNATLTVKTNRLDCFQYAWVVCIFIISSMFAAFGPFPTRFDSKTLVAS